MNEAHELDVLQAAWREGNAPVPAALGRLVSRQTWLLRFYTAIGILISIVFLGASLWQAIAYPAPEFIVLAIAIWILTLTTLIYSLSNSTGTWGPASHDTRAFLDLSLGRCRARLRAIRFGFYLLLVEVFLLAGWHAWYWSGRSHVPSISTWLAAACLPLAFLIALVAMRVRGRRELVRLERLERELFG